MPVPLVGRFRLEQSPSSNIYTATRPAVHRLQFGPHAAERFVVALRVAGQQRKVCMVQFRRRASTMDLYVNLSYFRHSAGMLGRFTLIGPSGTSQMIRFSEGGKTTSHLVKYNHPADGRAHFSQDRKIESFFTHATPLRDVRGHLFTVQFWGVDGFALAGNKEAKQPNQDRATVGFDLGADVSPEKLVGRIAALCFPRRMLASTRLSNALVDPLKPFPLATDDGEMLPTLVLAPPSPRPADDLLVLLTYHAMPPREEPGSPKMLFLGGFNAPGDPTSPDATADFLALKYAERDDGFDEMVRTMGTVDFQRTPTQ